MTRNRLALSSTGNDDTAIVYEIFHPMWLPWVAAWVATVMKLVLIFLFDEPNGLALDFLPAWRSMKVNKILAFIILLKKYKSFSPLHSFLHYPLCLWLLHTPSHHWSSVCRSDSPALQLLIDIVVCMHCGYLDVFSNASGRCVGVVAVVHMEVCAGSTSMGGWNHGVLWP